MNARLRSNVLCGGSWKSRAHEVKRALGALARFNAYISCKRCGGLAACRMYSSGCCPHFIAVTGYAADLALAIVRY
jgi:hypothetical protein